MTKSDVLTWQFWLDKRRWLFPRSLKDDPFHILSKYLIFVLVTSPSK